mmetsp:Transcript_2140/g.6714  ORF Transcript_2140/g.6714 Transcript_2140/m.6714 type:complete len:137 (+) Transcript_2140:1311-1721(+)
MAPLSSFAIQIGFANGGKPVEFPPSWLLLAYTFHRKTHLRSICFLMRPGDSTIIAWLDAQISPGTKLTAAADPGFSCALAIGSSHHNDNVRSCRRHCSRARSDSRTVQETPSDPPNGVETRRCLTRVRIAARNNNG